MARSPRREANPIYDLHRRWLLDVLPSGDSLLTPGEPVWSLEHLSELERDFVKSPDETAGKAYLDKLRDQLTSSSDGARQLMAELHIVHFMGVTTRSIAKDTKLATIRAILSWMAVPPAIPDDVAEAMSPGLYHPGQWALTRRDTQITWLIEFSRRFKQEDGPRLAGDPWTLRAFAESVVAPSADAARLALLHQTFPDAFEQSLSTPHKKLMAQRFSNLTTDTDDVDRQLLEVRAALSPNYGDGFNFYEPPLELMWFHGPAWKTFMGWLERFRVLPSFDEEERTYKERLAAQLSDVARLLEAGDEAWRHGLRAVLRDPTNNLTGWRVDTPFVEWVNADPSAAAPALGAVWGPGPPSERFTNFLDRLPAGLLPQPGQRIILGSFLLMAGSPADSPPVKVGLFRNAWKLAGFAAPTDSEPSGFYERAMLFLDELVHAAETWPTPLRDRLDAQGAVWSLTRWNADKHGVPTGWSQVDWDKFDAWRSSGGTQPDEDITAEDDEPDDEAAANDHDEPRVDYIADAARDCYVDRAVLDEIVRLLEDKRQVVLYGPPGTGKTFVGLRLAKAIAQGAADRVSLVQFHPATTYEDFFEGLRPTVTDVGQVTYELTPGPLVDIVERAAANPGHTYVMVIDEINRANLPKVFGELLFLLEYRNEPVRTLYRPTQPFTLPTNLWFIATMNTADRSVALVDAALRRRFHFVPFFPHDGAMRPVLRSWLTAHGSPTRIADFLDAVNDDLVAYLGDHLLIGPSYFMRSDLSEPALQQIWTYNVFPLLEEHLWGQRDEIQAWRWPAVQQRYATQLTGRTATEPDDPPPTSADPDTSA